MRQWTRTWIVMAMLLGLATMQSPAQQGPAAGGAAAPAPNLDSAVFVLEVGDLLEAIEAFGAIGQQINPMASAMGIKSMVGAQVGDPDLSGITPGSSLTALFFPTGQKAMYLKMDAEKAANYAQQAQANGMQAEVADGLVVLGQTPMDLTTGKQLMEEVRKQYIGQNDKPSLLGTVHVSRLMQQFGPMAEMMVGMMAQQAMSQQGEGGAVAPAQARMMEAQSRLALNLVKEIEQFQFELSAPEPGLLMDLRLTPLEGTPLAGFMASPKNPDPALANYLPTDAALRMNGGFDFQAYQKLLDQELEKVFTQMNMPEDEQAQYSKLIKAYGQFQGDQMAFAMALPGQGLISGAGIASKPGDPEAILASTEEAMQVMSEGSFGSMYKQMGIEQNFSFERDAAEYQGVSIHTTSFSQDYSNAQIPPQQKAFIEMFSNFETRMAFVNDMMVSSFGPTPIEPMIDAAKAGKATQTKPLAAVEDFGPEARAYMDMDLAVLGKVLVDQFREMPQMQQGLATAEGFLQQVAGVPPVTGAIFMQDSEARMGLLLPAETIGKVSQAAQAAMMAAMMQSQQGVQPAPQPAPAPSGE